MGNTLSHSLKFKKYKRILKEKVSFSPLAGVFLKQKKYIRNTFFFLVCSACVFVFLSNGHHDNILQ